MCIKTKRLVYIGHVYAAASYKRIYFIKKSFHNETPRAAYS